VRKTFALFCIAWLQTACATRTAPKVAPSACTAPVAPIRNTNIHVTLNYDFTYTPRDATEVRTSNRPEVIAQLNGLGAPNGNTFAETEGDNGNLTFSYTLNSDSQDRFTGSLRFSGWGQGLIHNFYTSGTYNSWRTMIAALTSQAYEFIRDGWHDSRPNCGGSGSR
jgi:hypothetical protein